MALWVMVGSSEEEWRRFVGQSREMGEKGDIDFFTIILYLCILY